MTTYNANGFAVKTTPADHVIDPACEATNGRHGLLYAHRYERCTCPGPAWDQHRAHRDAANARQRARKHAAKAERDAVVTRMTSTGSSGLRELTAAEAARPQRRAAIRDASSAEKELRKRDDLACQNVDPELFFVNGFGAAADAQIKVARQVCAACPFDAQRLCLRAGIERGDDFALLAGTTPQQRRQMRQQVAA